MADTPSSRKEQIDALLKQPGVEARKLNGVDAYFVADKMFACISLSGGQENMGLRLPAAMATELQFSSSDYISPFSPGGVATTREWVQLARTDPADYVKDLDLVQASLDYVKKGRR
jgi:hypothetical protein